MRTSVSILVSRRAAPYWGIFALALAVRLAHFWFMRENDPLFDVLLRGGDNHGYHRWALEIAQTFWLGWDRLPFTQGPLYPYFLGMALLRFGSSYATAVLVHHVLGAGTCVLLFSLARRVFGDFEAWIAALLAVFCPLFLLYEGEILAETLVVFVNVAALRLLLWAHSRQAASTGTGLSKAERFFGDDARTLPGKQPRFWWRYLAAGFVLGLCVLGRPNALLFVPVAAFWIVTASPAWRAGVAAACLVLLGTALAIAPATAANYFGGGEFVLVSKNGSWNLYIGNAFDASGTYERPPSMWKVVFDENANEADINWTPHLVASLREHPSSLPRLLWTKTRLFWQSGEVPHIANFYLKREFSPFLRIPLAFGVIAPLGIVGIVLTFLSKAHRRWRDDAVLLLLYLAVYSASIILVFVLSRLRLPALAVLLVFAAAALAAALRGAGYMTHALRKRDFRGALAFAAVPLVILVGWAALGFALHSRDDRLLVRWADHYNLATGYEIKGRPAEALAQYEAAIARAPHLAPKFAETMQTLREKLEPDSR